jgi:hypothetical protein
MGGGASPELFIRLPRHLFFRTPGEALYRTSKFK